MEKVITDRPYDMRRHARMPSVQPVHYLVSMIEAKNRTWLSCKGQLLETSETGICIQTNHPLSPGHIVLFDGSAEDKAGFVRWCRQLDSTYMIGIDLDKTSVRKLDEATNTFLYALKQIEDRCSDHTEDPDETLLQVKDAVDSVCTACETFEREIRDREMIRDAQVRFREKTDSILSKSYCINRARTWPQGYQGDYKTLEGIYRNTPLSDGIGFNLDLWGLNISLAVALRNRIHKLEMLLRDELRQRMSPAVMNIVEIMDSIEAAVRRMTSMLHDVLAIGRVEGGNIEVKPTPLRLREFCNTLIDEVLQGEIRQGRAGRVVELQMDGDPRACLDERLVQHILANLLSNGIKYSSAGGTVRFAIRVQAEAVEFSVSDHGIGIPQEDLAHLFETFRRGKNVGNIGGTGLGLAIVKNYVDLHGGHISVESAVGKGSCFTVTLPQGDAARSSDPHSDVKEGVG